MILPVLLYGSEVWGYEDISQIEVFHRKFLRTILFVNKCTPDCMVYGETGRGPILNHVKCRVVGFWSRTLKGKETKYSNFLLSFIYRLHKDESIEFNSPWLKFIEDTFNFTGLSNVWQGQYSRLSINSIVHMVKLRLKDMFCQEWNSVVWSNRICTNYRIFKGNHTFENYLQTLHQKDAITLCKFRCRSHTLPVNKGRFNANVPNIEMQCTLCLSSAIGDEFHYIFVCPYFHRERNLYLPKTLCALRFPSALHMEKLFDSKKACVLKKLAKFAHLIMLQFCHRPKKEDCSFNSSSTNTIRSRSTICTRSGRIVKQPTRFDL